MCNNRCINKLSTWIPFLLVSSICIVVPIVLGASYVNVLIGYGCATGTLILITTLMGIRFKGGLIAASVKSKRRLDGQWAIVTGANRYVHIYIRLPIIDDIVLPQQTVETKLISFSNCDIVFVFDSIHIINNTRTVGLVMKLPRIWLLVDVM